MLNKFEKQCNNNYTKIKKLQERIEILEELMCPYCHTNIILKETEKIDNSEVL